MYTPIETVINDYEITYRDDIECDQIYGVRIGEDSSSYIFKDTNGRLAAIIPKDIITTIWAIG